MMQSDLRWLISVFDSFVNGYDADWPETTDFRFFTTLGWQVSTAALTPHVSTMIRGTPSKTPETHQGHGKLGQGNVKLGEVRFNKVMITLN